MIKRLAAWILRSEISTYEKRIKIYRDALREYAGSYVDTQHGPIRLHINNSLPDNQVFLMTGYIPADPEFEKGSVAREALRH